MPNELNVIPAGDESGAPLGNKDTSSYVQDMIERFWQYRTGRFAGRDELFDRARRSSLRPPVFTRDQASLNLILPPNGDEDLRTRVAQTIPKSARHRWFQSMKSSQALTQSVFGNLIALGKLELLAGLKTADGEVAFYDEAPPVDAVGLERETHALGEPSRTSVDVMFGGARRVAAECKLTEWEVGSCSRPTMEDEDPRYCDGSYSFQQSNLSRCSLTTVGVKYWRYVPDLFHWRADQDQRPCPLRFTFQLVRNVLAASVTAEGKIAADAHALLVYDARNPAFQKDGAGLKAWQQTRTALKEPQRIRRIEWQIITKRLSEDSSLAWLTGELREKYGL